LTRTFIDAGVLIAAARTTPGLNHLQLWSKRRRNWLGTLAAMDAIHVAAALDLGADEMVTTEGPFKPMFRVPWVRFTTLGR
jgi:hypothetical protein